ncbi:PREDICTED: protein phosphatase 1 regulatory subunit 21-like, partial [Rhagoletis zephyria]|uniref:protein phosphatase 1 regulatory subunit 21-like n=1 Tax=Rhagoletis zephyria TaxID=28612 RepID=UPI0008112E62
LRAQFAVLKKGVLEEKAKSEELAETVKARDQAARRAAQETESLLFRNQQLTKRIAVLQNDIDETAAAASTPQKRAAGFLFAGGDGHGSAQKNRSASNASSASFSAVGAGASAVNADLVEEIHAELRSKLEENDRLQELVRTMEADREQELKALERRLREEADSAVNARLETLNGELKALTGELAKMKAEKGAREAKLAECLKSLQETTASVETL